MNARERVEMGWVGSTCHQDMASYKKEVIPHCRWVSVEHGGNIVDTLITRSSIINYLEQLSRTILLIVSYSGWILGQGKSLGFHVSATT